MFSVRQIKKSALMSLKGNRRAAALAVLVCAAVDALLCTPVSEDAPLWVDLIAVVATVISGGGCLLAWSTFFIGTTTGRRCTFWDFIQGFEHFLVGAATFAWCALWVFLWSLLFLIPGIVKTFSYSMTFFVLSENPSLGARRAIALSKVLTRGHKGDLFVLLMSFLLWEILAALTLEILQLWLAPYVASSLAHSYWQLKEEALRTGALTVADFQS